MSLFVEVNSVEKGCPVIINLDHIVEIAPLASGGCALFMIDGAGMNSKTGMRVSDSYNLFKQFAMQTVTPEDIARRFPKETSVKEPAPEAPAKKTKKEEFEIPKFGE
jgi:hypothetical protein